MSTWEERMAIQSRAKGRHYLQEQERQRQAAYSEYNRIHGGHHRHLQGTAVYCSCGQFEGITCVAFPPEWAAMAGEEIQAAIDAQACSICGERGVLDLMG